MTTIKTIAIIALLAACGGSKPAPTAPAPTGTGDSQGAVLGITELKFYEGDQLRAHLLADGSFEIQQGAQWAKVGTFSPDGKVMSNDGKGAQVQPDGTLKAIGGSTPDDAGIKLDRDTLIVQADNGEHRVTLDAKGNVMVDGKPGDDAHPMRVEGASDVASRRTALLVVGLMVTPSRGDAPATAPATK